MRTMNYTLKGKEVPSHLAGTVLRIKNAETLAEAAKELTVKGESDVVEKFNDGYVIALQGLLRTRAAGKRETKDGPTVYPTPEQLQALADEYKYTERVEGEGVARATKPETKQRNAAADSGQKLFERALANPKFLKQMVDVGVIDEGVYQAWLQARSEAETAKAQAEGNAVTGAPQA